MKIKNLFLVFIIFWACKSKYMPAINYPATGYLVVEGFINAGTDPLQFHYIAHLPWIVSGLFRKQVPRLKWNQNRAPALACPKPAVEIIPLRRYP